MAITREAKKEIIENLTDRLSTATSGVLTDPTGLKVNEIQSIRSSLRKNSISFKVIKKTLVKIATNKAGINLPKEAYEGSLAFSITESDEIAPARIIWENNKKYANLKIVGGIFKKEFISAERVIELAKIPSRDELYIRLVRTVSSPLYGTVNVLKANTLGLINVLSAYKEQKSIN